MKSTSRKIAPGQENGLGVLPPTGRTALLVGALGSVALTLQVGHRNKSILLIALFAIWVLSPFVVLLLADRASKHWPVRTQKTLYGLMLVLALASLAIYGVVAFGPPRPKVASVFLLVPLASWVLIGIALSMAHFTSRKV